MHLLQSEEDYRKLFATTRVGTAFARSMAQALGRKESGIATTSNSRYEKGL